MRRPVKQTTGRSDRQAQRQPGRQMREDAKSVPIIAMTANAFDEDVLRSLQAGMNAHLTKPVDAPRLLETLQTLIKE